jgi:hypothetical protein
MTSQKQKDEEAAKEKHYLSQVDAFLAGVSWERARVAEELNHYKEILLIIANQPDVHPLAAYSHQLARNTLAKYPREN